MPSIEIIRDLGDLPKIGAEWAQLQQRIGEHSIFLTHDWFQVCAANLRRGQELLVTLVRDNGRLVAIAPLVRSKRRIRHMPVTRIEFLRNEISPFADFLAIDPAESLKTILVHLFAHEKDWDILWLSGLRENSAARQYLTSAHGTGTHGTGAFLQSVVAQTPYLALTTTWENFYNGKSRKFRMTKRSITNRLHRLQGVEVLHFSGAQDALKGLELLLEVSSKSWKRRENRDLIDADFEKKFFTDLTKVAGERGWLQIWVLMAEGKPIAAEYHLQGGQVVYGVRAHYVDELSFYSPGAFLDLEIVKALHTSGIDCYDMGTGAADYKLAWTEQMYPVFGLELYNQTAYARCVRGLQNSLIPAIKRSPLVRHFRRHTREEA